MFWWLFLIGLVNIGLGYGLAVYLGYGPPWLRQTFERPSPDGASSQVTPR